MNPLSLLGRADLVALADALESERLRFPFTPASVARVVAAREAPAVGAELDRIQRFVMGPKHLAWTLRLLADEKAVAQRQGDGLDLVWSGPEAPGSTSRDTGAVVRELFATARRTVLIASYALDRGDKARDLFGGLAARMDEEQALQVRMFVNVRREHGSEVPDSVVLRQFADAFRADIWPGSRLPEVFFDPRALEGGSGPKACLHAKCVVVDDERAFITSANFTEAAQERNIEAGVLVIDGGIAVALRRQFETLMEAGALCRVAGS